MPLLRWLLRISTTLAFLLSLDILFIERDLAFFNEKGPAGAIWIPLLLAALSITTIRPIPALLHPTAAASALLLLFLLPRLFVGTDELVSAVVLTLWLIHYWRQSSPTSAAMRPIGYTLAAISAGAILWFTLIAPVKFDGIAGIPLILSLGGLALAATLIFLGRSPSTGSSN